MRSDIYMSPTDVGDTYVSLLRVQLERFGILKQSKQRETTAMIPGTRRMGKITECLRKLNSERKIKK